MEKYYRSYITVDLSAMRHNLMEAKAKIGRYCGLFCGCMFERGC